MKAFVMTRRSRKKASGQARQVGDRSSQKVDNSANEEKLVAGPDTPRAAGLPAPKSIAGETEFTSSKGFKYRIIHTTEVDPSDQPKPSNPRPKGKQPRHKM
jgi:hypothetical protein